MSDETNDILETQEGQPAVDFDDSESRMTFLKSQLNDLLDGINDTYGQELMEELLKRLEKTVEDYNEEVSRLMGKLKSGKIFQSDAAAEPTDPSERAAADSEFDDASAMTADNDDADIIARMKARITHD